LPPAKAQILRLTGRGNSSGCRELRPERPWSIHQPEPDSGYNIPEVAVHGELMSADGRGVQSGSLHGMRICAPVLSQMCAQQTIPDRVDFKLNVLIGAMVKGRRDSKAREIVKTEAADVL
jgi:hypothetical protein